MCESKNQISVSSSVESLSEKTSSSDMLQWYVMRDLKRSNALYPAYKELGEQDFEVFTPLQCRTITRKGKREQVMVPVLSDLLFVRSTRSLLDPVVTRISTLQYRYVRGAYCQPMVVRDVEMEHFMRAVQGAAPPRYFRPEEITPAMCGHQVCIEGGPFDGCEGKLLKVRGTRRRHLLVSIPGLIAASVEVAPENVRLVDEVTHPVQ